MGYPKKLILTDEARDSFRRLDQKVAARLFAKIQRFAETGAGVVEPLTGRPGSKLRVGDWRVLFLETGDTVEATKFGHRSEVYK